LDARKHWLHALSWKLPICLEKNVERSYGRVCVELEAMVDYDLWIWHIFISMARPHNDINLLQHSLVSARLAKWHAPEWNYEVNGQQYTKGTT
jgi:hypothetical protein